MPRDQNRTPTRSPPTSFRRPRANGCAPRCSSCWACRSARTPSTRSSAHRALHRGARDRPADHHPQPVARRPSTTSTCTYQILHIVFALVPVALALYLLSATAAPGGAAWAEPRRPAVVARRGVGLRPGRRHRPARPRPVRRGPRDRPDGARQHLRASRRVVGRRDPARLGGRRGMLEEVIVVGYLVTRLRELRWWSRRPSSHRPCCAAPTTCTRAGRWRWATW